jgi:hypothetical protein
VGESSIIRVHGGVSSAQADGNRVRHFGRFAKTLYLYIFHQVESLHRYFCIIYMDYRPILYHV